MAKQCGEVIGVTCEENRPTAFHWRGQTYRVRSVLGHWREDAGYWWGSTVEIPQRDLWRVEARCGVYELVAEAGSWRLARVWD